MIDLEYEEEICSVLNELNDIIQRTINIDEDWIQFLKKRLVMFMEGNSMQFAAEAKIDALYSQMKL